MAERFAGTDRIRGVKVTKKQQTLCGALVMFLGILGGVVGTAFSMGAEQQRIKDALTTNDTEIAAMKVRQNEYKENLQKEMDRYAQIIAAKMTQLQSSISQLTISVGDLRTDVQVLKVLMERVEKDIQAKTHTD